ncbi:MAG: hypothetical protein NTU58_00810 [Candidatus Nealsonbacteria bacterium]|nr:hypothetical protein [Candidatus Nealsonbacteria bacterium]
MRRKKEKGGENIEEARINLIAKQAFKAHLRHEFSLRDIQKIKRNIGNSLKEPEMQKINVTKEEALEFVSIVIREVFEDLMVTLEK